MRDPSFYVSSLLELANASPEERRPLWRQAMAALSRASAEEGPSPLEGLHPEVLLRGVHAALEAGLVDDLDWLSPSAAGVAMYTLASGLPVGPEQRELGRRVLAQMLAGNAETFTAMATKMAQGGGKGLTAAAIRARVVLVTELPLAHGVADGALALALVSRREAAREWVDGPSTRSLPARRLAAKILERAAREAARRAQMGDRHALRVFAADAVRSAWDRLLGDREPLVWRYVAVARGLVAEWLPEQKKEMLEGLARGAGFTAGRRAVASLAAYGAVNPEEAVRLTKDVIKRGLFTKEDPGAAGAFVWGLPRAIEAEPEAATKMLDALLAVASPDVGESIYELTFEYGPSKVVEHACRRALDIMRTADPSVSENGDDGAEALFTDVVRDLEDHRKDVPLRVQASRALDAFAREGAHVAYAKARGVLDEAKGAMVFLEAATTDDEETRRVGMVQLRDLDMSLLERSIVAEMLKLGRVPEQVRASEAMIDEIRERFAEWIVSRESSLSDASTGRTTPHATLRLRRLRALLHLLDGDLGEGTDVPRSRGSEDGAEIQRAKRLRALWLRTVHALLERFTKDPAPVLKRTLLATLARAVDALVRFGVCDAADALLVLGQRIRTTGDFETLAEASMDPDLRHVLVRYAKFLRDTEPTLEIEEPRDSLMPPSASEPPAALHARKLAALEELASELAPEASARSEALRSTLVRLQGALASLTKVGSLRGLSTNNTSEPDVITGLEAWTGALQQMCIGARARLEPDAAPASVAPPQPKLLSMAVSRVLAGAEATLEPDALGPAVQELSQGMCHGIARLVNSAIWSLVDLPVERASFTGEGATVVEQLPAWLPARRTIGGFYVVKSLGVGGTASVFVVNRVEDRHESNAERFALKVPDYNATAARSVSQDEFFKLFREEASALIMLPNHANLARFVTFDLAARPLPILVMELVEGVTLERVIDSRTFDAPRALKVMDDVLGGLEAMHGAGVGHLDIKPSNVVLRKGEQGVLVDFGLSGRKIRPGCGTGPYGAPEVWGVIPDGVNPMPMASDIYSFGCLAFEMLTGRMLFEANNEVAQIAMHVSHDGFPPRLRELMANPEFGPIAEALAPALRRDPRQRPSAEQLRRDIKSVAAMISGATWPAALG